MKELSCCLDYEVKITLSLIKGMRQTLQNEEESDD